MSEEITTNAAGDVILVTYRNDETEAVEIVYDMVSGEVTNFTGDTPDVEPLKPEVRDHFRSLGKDVKVEAGLREAVQHIQNVLQMAEDDRAVAQALRDQSAALAVTLSQQAATIGAWKPSTTYKVADMTTIRDQLQLVTQRQQLIAEAMRDQYAYRKANDEAVATIYRAVLWMAQKISRSL